MGDMMNFLPKSRLDAFADGVFAIVITLLVLDLPEPDISKDILSSLMESWPEFLAYLLSFAFIGGIWISHSSITQLMKHETTTSYRLTLLMLFFVSVLPFTTNLMAKSIGFDSTIPVTIYGLDLLAASLTLNAIIKLATITPDILVDESARSTLNTLLRRRQFSATILVGVVIIGFFFPKIAIFGYIAVAVLFFITPPITTVSTKRRQG
jgi:uncharacterized membrane protein